MRVVDRIEECRGRGAPIRKEAPLRILVHRIGSADGDWESEHGIGPGLPGLCEWFGHVPYSFLIEPSGEIEQAAPLSRHSWDALGRSAEGISVALRGDFTRLPPTEQQKASLAWLCAKLWSFFGALPIAGHTSLPGSTKHRGKVCPGPLLDLEKIAKDTHAIAESGRRNAVRMVGIAI